MSNRLRNGFPRSGSQITDFRGPPLSRPAKKVDDRLREILQESKLRNARRRRRGPPPSGRKGPWGEGGGGRRPPPYPPETRMDQPGRRPPKPMRLPGPRYRKVPTPTRAQLRREAAKYARYLRRFKGVHPGLALLLALWELENQWNQYSEDPAVAPVGYSGFQFKSRCNTNSPDGGAQSNLNCVAAQGLASRSKPAPNPIPNSWNGYHETEDYLFLGNMRWRSVTTWTRVQSGAGTGYKTGYIQPQVLPIHPALEPQVLPITAPAEIPAPLPYKVQKALDELQKDSRLEDSTRGYVAPGDIYGLTHNLGPFDELYMSTSVEVDTNGDYRFINHGMTGHTNRPADSKDKGEREGKYHANSMGQRIVVGAWALFTEGTDFVEALHGALPPSCRVKGPRDLFSMAEAVYKCGHRIDIDRFIALFALNMLEDTLYGLGGNFRKKWMRDLELPFKRQAEGYFQRKVLTKGVREVLDHYGIDPHQSPKQYLESLIDEYLPYEDPGDLPPSPYQ